MKLFDALASAFFKTFGITQPSEDRLRRAAWFILALLLLSFAVISIIGVVLYHLIYR